MNMKGRSAAAAVLGAWILAAEGFAVETVSIDEKTRLEAHLTGELTKIIDRYLGTQKAHVSVFVDAEVDKIVSPDDYKASAAGQVASSQILLWKDLSRRRRVSLMPGFTAPQEVSVTEEKRKAQQRDGDESAAERIGPVVLVKIKKIVATVVLDRSISDEDVQKTKVLSAEVLGLDPERGDVLNVYKLSFIPGWRREIMEMQLLRRLLPFLIWGLFLAVMTAWVCRMIRPLLEAASGRRPAAPAAAPEVQVVASSAEASGEPDAIEAAGSSANEEPKGAGTGEAPAGSAAPLGFINGQNAERMAVLLHELNYRSEEIAAVVGLLPADVGARVLEHLPDPRRAEVFYGMCRMRTVKPEALRAFGEKVKVELEHSYGGVCDLVSLLEAMDEDRVESYLSFLAKTDAPKARQARDRLFRFEDLLALPEDQFPALTQAGTTAEWSLALVGLKVRAEGFLRVFPEDARNAIVQRMEFTKAAPEVIRMARTQVLRKAKELARQGQLKLAKRNAPPPSGQQTPLPRPAGQAIGFISKPEIAAPTQMTPLNAVVQGTPYAPGTAGSGKGPLPQGTPYAPGTAGSGNGPRMFAPMPLPMPQGQAPNTFPGKGNRR